MHKGIHLVLDYESLRTNSKGCGRPIQVYQSELVEPNNGLFTFPLYEAEVQRLSLFMRRPSIPALEPRSSLPFDGPVTPVPTRKRRTYITLERAIKSERLMVVEGARRLPKASRIQTNAMKNFVCCLKRSVWLPKPEPCGHRQLLQLQTLQRFQYHQLQLLTLQEFRRHRLLHQVLQCQSVRVAQVHRTLRCSQRHLLIVMMMIRIRIIGCLIRIGKHGKESI